MPSINRTEAELILQTLGEWHQELEAIAEAGDRLRHTRHPETEDWRRRLVQVKADIKDAAKSGTLDGSRRELSDLERSFFDPAARHASAHFSLRSDAPPSKWAAGLYNPAGDISYYMFELREHAGLKED